MVDAKMKTSKIKIRICDQDGALLSSVDIDVDAVSVVVKYDQRAIMFATHEATNRIENELTAAIRRNWELEQ